MFIEAQILDGRLVFRGDRSASLGHPVGAEGLHGGWQSADDHVAAWTDDNGLFPVFYFADDRRCMVSSSVLELIANGAPSDLNDPALGVFFRLGWFIGEDTPFASIRALPPGGRLDWRSGRLELRQRTIDVAERPMTIARAQDCFVELFRESVERCVAAAGGDIVVPLSGGRDSRHILLELSRQKVDVKVCLTYNHNLAGLDHEASAAKAVTDRLRQPHQIIDGLRIGYAERMRTAALTHFCSDEHPQMLALRDHPQIGAMTLFDGIGGDVLSRNGGFSSLGANAFVDARDWRGLASTLMEGHAHGLGYSVEDYLASRGLGQRCPRHDALDYLSRTIERHAGFADPYTAFLFFSRTRREIALAPTAMLSTARAVVCPYVSADLIRFLLSLPREITRGGQFHDEIIARAFPQMDGLAYATTARRWSRQPIRSHVAKVLRSLQLSASIHRLGPGMVREANYLWQRRGARTEAQDCLLDGLALASSAAGARRLLRVAHKDHAKRARPTAPAPHASHVAP